MPGSASLIPVDSQSRDVFQLHNHNRTSSDGLEAAVTTLSDRLVGRPERCPQRT